MAKKNSRGTKLTALQLHFKFPKYFKRLFIVYFVLFVILLGIVGGAAVAYKSSDDDYDVFVENTMKIEKFKKDTDIIFDTTEVMVNLISEYDITQKYAAMKTDIYSQRDFGALYELIKTISKIQTNFAGYNLSIAMTKYTDNLVVSGYGNMETVDTFIEENGIDIHKAVSMMVDVPPEVEYKIIESDKVTDNMTVLYRRRPVGGDDIYLFLFFGNDGMQYMYDAQSGRHIVYNNYIDEYNDEVLKRIEENESLAMDYFAIDDKTSCFIANSDNEQERIVYVEFFTDKSGNLLLIMLPWLVIMILVAAVCAGLLSEFSYIPLRGVLEKFGVAREKDIDELAAMEEIVDAMMEKNRNLHISVLQKDKILRNRFLFDVLNGYIWGDKLHSLSCENGVGFINGKCHIIMMETENSSEENELAFESVVGMNGKMLAVLEEKFEGFTNTAVCTVQGGRMVLISECKTNQLSLILEFIDAVQCENGVGINVAVGEAVGEDGEIPKVYRLLSSGIDNKSLIRKKGIITEEDIKAMAKSRIVYSAETEAMLTKYVVDGEKMKALYCLNNILASNEEAVAENIEEFKMTMAITVKRILDRLDVTETEVFGASVDVREEMNNAATVEELFATIKGVFQIISEYVVEDFDSEDKTVGGDILKFIRENLGRDISIGDVAEHFGMSVSSVGRILRIKYNTTFKTYINDERIKKAKQMMDADKNILVKDLAYALGYNNAVSFIRMFKKSEGVSPGQYIKMK